MRLHLYVDSMTILNSTFSIIIGKLESISNDNHMVIYNYHQYLHIDCHLPMICGHSNTIAATNIIRLIIDPLTTYIFFINLWVSMT